MAVLIMRKLVFCLVQANCVLDEEEGLVGQQGRTEGGCELDLAKEHSGHGVWRILEVGLLVQGSRFRVLPARSCVPGRIWLLFGERYP